MRPLNRPSTPSPLRPGALALAAASLLALSGCSSLGNLFGSDQAEYQTKAGKTQPLEVPPDLTQLARDSRYRAQTGAPVTASGTQAAAQQATGGNTAAPLVAPQAIEGLRIERQGNQRWLVAPIPAEQLWPRLREFWQERGFSVVLDDSAAGVMETNWAENRAKIPTDFIRRTIGRLFDSAYSSSERDRFRTRVERVAGGTEVYISHRGMEEIYTSPQRDSTAWRARPADPQMEAEYLTRLMIKLGVKEDAARAAVTAAAEPPPRARPVAAPAAAPGAPSGATSLEVDDSFDRAWRRVGLALDRSSFTVEDRDRAAGLYFVRYVDPKSLPSEDAGFLSRLFSSDANARPVRYRVALKAAGNKTTVTVQNSQGGPETGDAAKAIIGALERDLR